MKTIEFFLIKNIKLSKKYIEENIVCYGELRARDFKTDTIYELKNCNSYCTKAKKYA